MVKPLQDNPVTNGSARDFRALVHIRARLRRVVPDVPVQTLSEQLHLFITAPNQRDSLFPTVIAQSQTRYASRQNGAFHVEGRNLIESHDRGQLEMVLAVAPDHTHLLAVEIDLHLTGQTACAQMEKRNRRETESNAHKCFDSNEIDSKTGSGKEPHARHASNRGNSASKGKTLKQRGHTRYDIARDKAVSPRRAFMLDRAVTRVEVAQAVV